MDFHYYIVVYQKINNMKYIGHLDLMNFWQKIIRISNFPIAYSNGFNKKMKLNLIQPLSLGVEGLNEYIHLTFLEEIDIEKLINKINQIQQNKLIIKKISKTKYPGKWFNKHLNAILYQIQFANPIDFSSIVNNESSNKIISFNQTQNTEIFLKVVNTVDSQTNIFKLFSHFCNVDIINIKRVRIEYK
jgi:radical SAM-linked protein